MPELDSEVHRATPLAPIPRPRSGSAPRRTRRSSRAGERLYLKARRGEDVVRSPERPRSRFCGWNCVAYLRPTLDHRGSECSTGTYIRSLARRPGRGPGLRRRISSGLRRLWVEPFERDAMWSMDELGERVRQGGSEGLVLPIDAALRGWPETRLDPAETERLRRGMEVARDDPGLDPGKVPRL